MTTRQATLKLSPALRRWFDWHVDEADGHPPEVKAVVPIEKLIGEAWATLGEEAAQRIYATTVASWTQETGRCEICGGAAHNLPARAESGPGGRSGC